MVFWGMRRVFGMGVKVGVRILLMTVGVLMDFFLLKVNTCFAISILLTTIL